MTHFISLSVPIFNKDQRENVVLFTLGSYLVPNHGAHPDIFLIGCPCGGYCTNTVYRMAEKVTHLPNL